MVDSSDTSLANVKSSYDDVNNALENLLGNVGGNSNYATIAALTALENKVDNISGTNPVGTVLAFTTNTIPNGYLLCNGASFDTSKYSQLYSALGTASVPDMRGLFLRGLDTTGSVDNYSSTISRPILSYEEGTLVYASLGEIQGASAWYSGNPSPFNINTFGQTQGWDTASTIQSPYANWQVAGATDGDTTDQTGKRNTVFGISRPKNIAVNYIIKAVA